MSLDTSVQDYVQRQSKLGWRRTILRLWLRFLMFVLGWVKVSGLENIPDEGPTILMMNHISALDPGVVMAVVNRRHVIPMTKEEAAKDWFMGPFVKWYGAFTVKRGEVDRQALLISIELLKSGELVLIAPEGTRSKTGLIEPKDGMTYIATKADAVIVPTAVTDCVDWKHRLTHFRKANITITFGKPFKFNTAGRSLIPRKELTQMTREAMYQLALTLPDASLRGAYSDVENATIETLVFVGESEQPLALSKKSM